MRAPKASIAGRSLAAGRHCAQPMAKRRACTPLTFRMNSRSFRDMKVSAERCIVLPPPLQWGVAAALPLRAGRHCCTPPAARGAGGRAGWVSSNWVTRPPKAVWNQVKSALTAEVVRWASVLGSGWGAQHVARGCNDGRLSGTDLTAREQQCLAVLTMHVLYSARPAYRMSCACTATGRQESPV